MLKWFQHRSERRRTARELYGSIVALARAETFYTTWQVPDSAEGRLEMMHLHMVAVLDRLGRTGAVGVPLAQALVETFVSDMDANMRELGVGDLAVPRKIKLLAGALAERHKAYLAALGDAGDQELTLAIERQLRILPDGGEADGRRLARYLRDFSGRLAALPDDAVLAGHISGAMAGDVRPQGPRRTE